VSEQPRGKLPRGAVVALVAIAIVTAFFVGRSVTQPAPPPPPASGQPLELIDEASAGAVPSTPQPAASAPDRAPASAVTGSVASNAAEPVPAGALELAPAEPAGDASVDPGVVAVEPPPPPVEGELR
jgi:hypothetical protein